MAPRGKVGVSRTPAAATMNAIWPHHLALDYVLQLPPTSCKARLAEPVLAGRVAVFEKPACTSEADCAHKSLGTVAHTLYRYELLRLVLR